MSHGRGVLRTALIVAAALVAGWVGRAAAQDDVAADEPRAGLVIALPDGQVRTMCVDLGAPEISGDDLLRRAGVAVSARVTPLGTMVCGLDGQGCDHPREPCWCACRSLGGDCRYWAYHVREDAGWRYAPLGPGARRVRHGDVDGWAWGAGSLVSGATPPDLGWAAICGDDGATREATATQAPTAVATAVRSTAPPGAVRATQAARSPGTPTVGRGTRETAATTATEGADREPGAAEDGRVEDGREKGDSGASGGAGVAATPSAAVAGGVDGADGAGAATAGGARAGDDEGVTPEDERAEGEGAVDGAGARLGGRSEAGGRSDRGARARRGDATRDVAGNGSGGEADDAPGADTAAGGMTGQERAGAGTTAVGSRRGDYLFFIAVFGMLVVGVWWLRRAA